ncbi:MAG: L-serine ammonia-lyase, iron-sulfur-dependent, subunit alpha [Erysipelotrichales bacterium]
MQSLREFYKVGPGPSSSHTMGPQRAAKKFKEKYPDASKYIVTLYGSLSLTGKGHLTDWIILETLKGTPTEIKWVDEELPNHPNGMIFQAFDENDKELDSWTIYSVGGGSIEIEGFDDDNAPQDIYELNKLDDIYTYIQEKNISLVDYVKEVEGEDIQEFLEFIVQEMLNNAQRGLDTTGMIPGDLKLIRVAQKINKAGLSSDTKEEKHRLLVSSYAYAVSEENASGGLVVTAPTCGASGVMPAIMYYYHHDLGFSIEKLAQSLAVAGVFGNLIKQNASISGAEGGCQAEVGTACSMAAAAVSYLDGLNLSQIEYAAEIAIEHHLGLTCDPVFGYVQIPCIERNGQAALRALDAALYAKALGEFRTNSISFDTVVNVMRETGNDLNHIYRETALGGLAINYIKNNKLEK